MKTLINSNGCSMFLFDDDKIVRFKENSIEVGIPVEFIIGNVIAEDAILVEGVTEPDDWFGCKYNYVNGVWELCPDWVDPRLEQ